MSEQMKLVCPNCGKELEIPADLEEFSCLYCGQRCRTAQVLAQHARAGSQYDALRQELRQNLPKAVVNYPDLLQYVTKKEFPETFALYERDNTQVLLDFDICARLRPGMVEQSVREICKDLVDALEANMTGRPGWNRNNTRNRIIFENKVVLAVFLTPLARKLKLETAELFREELLRQWMERFPKDRWTPGDYDEIMSGFRKNKLCFITTAVCAHEGKPDDCAELTAFRTFRDGWLTGHGGREMIARYYEIAPTIVTCMTYCDDPDARCAELRERWLGPCYRALQEGRYVDCRDRYAAMVRALERRYLA